LIAAANPNECSIWPFSERGDGYGQIRTEDGETDYAHRISWKTVNGKIPEGKFVLHRCDVRACVNPHHLFLGTHTDNMQDAKRKERLRGGAPPGERNGRALLKDWQIKNIRVLHAHGKTYNQLAKIYHAKPRTLKAICQGQNWKHATGPLTASFADPTVAWNAVIWGLKQKAKDIDKKIQEAEEKMKMGDSVPKDFDGGGS